MTKKFTEFTDQGAAIEPTDYLVGVVGSDNARSQIKDITKKIWLDDTITTPPYRAYQLWADPANGCVTADTGIDGVRACIPFEQMRPVYNDTGATILNGTPLMAVGVYVGGVPSVTEADADNPLAGIGWMGVATHDIPDGTRGASTIEGAVNDVDTSGLVEGPVYVASGGGLTNTPPSFPAVRVLVGGASVISATAGVVGVGQLLLSRQIITGAYPFTSNGVGSGSYYIAGDYDWSATDANLTQASTTITYGTANAATGAHAGAVFAGAGTVNAGTVALRVTGTSFTDNGTTTPADSEVLTSDITTLTANQYIETAKNWTGQVTYELVSTGATTYSLDFNYGFSAYIDASNMDFTIDAIRAEGICGGTDSSFTVTLRKHSTIGWTYAASGFSAGNGTIADMATDMAPNSTIVNGKHFKYKRTGLSEFINGSGSEGFLIGVTTGNNNSIQSMISTITLYSESLV